MLTTIVPDHHLPHPQHRVRHIKSIQIRNLTPFPARDAIAQSLTQPSRNSVLVPHSADDIELGVLRRKRRISSSSVMVSYNPEVEEDESTPLTRSSSTQRRRSGSKSSLRTVSGSPSASRRLSSNHHSSFIAARHVVSFAEDDASHALDTQTPSPLFVIHSQKHLEKIISSRLIETFITLSSLPSAEDILPSRISSTLPLVPTTSAALSSNTTMSPTKKLKEVSSKKVSSTNKPDHRKGPSVSSVVSHKSTSSVPRTPVSPTPAPRSRAGDRASTSKTGFTSPPTPPPESPKAKQHNFSSSKTVPSRPSSRGQDAPQDSPSPSFPTPFYISSIHQPSTNPTFAHLDPEREFANWADITASKFQVAIWGRTDKSNTDFKDRGKDTVTQSVLGKTFTWQILDEWTVDLDATTLFNPDSSGHTLPSNTLLITLASGDILRVLPKSADTAVSQSQSSLIDHGYNSDTELDKLLTRGEGSQQARDLIARNMRETRMKKSATYQDLVKLINLQTVIADTQQLLENTIRTCNLLIESDRHDPSRREISELENSAKILHGERAKVRESIERDSLKLEEKRKMLRRRRENLVSAKDLYRQNIEEYSDIGRTFAAEQERHSNLVSQIPALRTSLIQLVNFIFPIEPVSPQDLLFSILDSPLPVPTSPNEPAPPISMSAFPTVSEESVSTALGHVAQVTQLISAYLGQRLVYPVTCYGSRSVIKDPISAMAGPRIFPLYSKGVETYRFEYGVFLLNKNIEMFMSERNLRALDIRHTLPNLKNLILTLTTADEVEEPIPERKRLSEVSEVSSPVSPSAAVSSRQEANDSSTTSSTSSTQQSQRKSAPFFYPFTSLLSSRYPSSLGRPKVKAVDESPEQSEDTPPSEDDGTPSASELTPQIRVTADDEPKGLPSGGELSVDVAAMHRNPLEKSTSNSETTSPSPSLSEVA